MFGNMNMMAICLPRSIIAFLIFTVLCWCQSDYIFASESNSDVLSRLVVRQEKIVRNGVLISRPVMIDEIICNLLIFNKIKTVSEYTQWLGGNIAYEPDDGHDCWAAPEETLNRRYGDCEDIAFLNQSALRVLGFQSDVLALMRIGQNHAICVFKENGYYFLIDNTRYIATLAKNREELAICLTEMYYCSSIYSLDFATKKWDKLVCRNEFN